MWRTRLLYSSDPVLSTLLLCISKRIRLFFDKSLAFVISLSYFIYTRRGVAQLGRALRSGRRGRTFESCHPDHSRPLISMVSGFFIGISTSPAFCTYRMYRLYLCFPFSTKCKKYVFTSNLCAKNVLKNARHILPGSVQSLSFSDQNYSLSSINSLNARFTI